MNPATELSEHLRRIGSRLYSGDWQRVLATREPPLRAELFSAEQMEEHGRALAARHRLSARRAPDSLLSRLAANENALLRVCAALTQAVSAKRPVTPAGEWLLDNFYLIEEQVRTAKRHLPKRYSLKLPRLATGTASAAAGAGSPRVYDIALEIVAHGDGRVDTEVLTRFIAAYQSVTPLTLGELWATPIMLRLAVIENLRRVGVAVAGNRSDQNLADLWADQLMQVADSDPKNLILVIADLARSNPPLVSAFVAELARRLHGRGPALALPLSWIEQQLAESGQTIEHLIQLENQQQATDQVSISNSIGSLRLLGAVNWREFVESLSVVEQTLRDDPDAVYSRMDFATRDRYRHAAEALAAKSERAEGEVARAALALARAAADAQGSDARERHVGFYLLDKGLARLEAALAYRPAWPERLRRRAARQPLFFYLVPVFALSAALAAVMLEHSGAGAALPISALVLFAVLWLIGASQSALALVNWVASLVVTPHLLPRLDFSSGVPPEARTLVVVPTLLTSPASVASLLEALEVRFLANRDARLHYGLLTDFADASSETLPGDDELVAQAKNGIDELNAKYRGGADEVWEDIFFLFHRKRLWNAHERVWMGYERKRGKLAALNALLRSGAREAFALIVGDTALLSAVKYVITLDTDTQLPRDAARQFIGAMAHPLNRPRHDEVLQRVVDGYGILQPRVDSSLPGTNRSRYARLFGGEPGIDPYTRAVSDVYQDAFGEGSFIGKGIYEVDAFEQALSGRFPENLILSHDLIEGCYARSGLLSDVSLFEGYPASYLADVARRHRWIRGDWQIARWLLPRVPVGAGQGGVVRRKNTLSLLAQWKIFDNLRRSLVAAALCLLLVGAWLWLPAAPAWTLTVVAMLLVPALLASVVDLLRWPAHSLPRPHLAAVGKSAARRFAQLAFAFATLPFEAYYSVDAILRTLWRMLIAKRGLLEWNPASESEAAARASSGSLVAFARAMWAAPAIASVLAAIIVAQRPALLFLVAPILLLWFISPFIAFRLSRPLVAREVALGDTQRLFLRRLARRIWDFFDQFVNADENWLPPDNYQTYRIAAVAHRTSPTNIGLALLANLSAHDFGYITLASLIERTTQTFATMGRLERHRGHFLNWYDTQNLQPLSPRYVSTVDSGNLAAHLLTLRAGLLGLPDEPVFGPRIYAGLNDTLSILAEIAGGVAAPALKKRLAEFRLALYAAWSLPPVSLPVAGRSLRALVVAAERLVAESKAAADAAIGPPPDSDGKGSEKTAADALRWAQALARQCADGLEELQRLAPWLAFASSLGDAASDDKLELDTSIPSLRALAALQESRAQRFAEVLAAASGDAERTRIEGLQQGVAAASEAARATIAALEQLAREAGEFAAFDYDFLYDYARHLLTIGYNVSDHRRDAGYYDLLASEARLASFVAIAQGALPQENWFSLGRLLAGDGGEPVLLSWTGSMFEYLMPLLVMPTFDETLLDQTYQAAVDKQIEYGAQRGVAWGMSESGYNTVDLHFNYQYRAFGVPGLGLKRGLAEDLVVAPYASVMALMVAPEKACANLQRLEHEGFLGRFGFFEAIDYTPARQRRGRPYATVLSYMAHHQAMSLLALSYLLLDRPMQKRFAADPQFQAVMPLLQERVPRASAVFSRKLQLSAVRPMAEDGAQTPVRIFTSPDTLTPEVQLLSNGRYHVMVSNAGGGYSRWRDLAVTRWREDATRDNWGAFCYLRELAGVVDRDDRGGEAPPFWSIAHQPTLKKPETYEAIFSEGRAEFRRRDAVASGLEDGGRSGYFETHSEIVVSPEDDIELRRTRITNRSRTTRAIEITTYAEVVIAPAVADTLHPAFSNLFVQSELVPERHALLCTRRPRAHGEQTPTLLHLLVVHGAEALDFSYETDRARFIGRGRSCAAPRALSTLGPLSGSVGSVLDPIVAIRCRVVLEPEQVATFDVVTGMTEQRDAALALAAKYQDRHLADRVFDLAWTHSQVVLRQLNASEAGVQLYGRLASSVLYANAGLRPDPAILLRNRRGQSGLWGYAISGDLPIILLRIGDAGNIELARQLVEAHAYWRLKGLAVDLVIWNEDHASYRQHLQDEIVGLIASGIEASLIDRPGGIFVRLGELVAPDDRVLFQSVARAVITDERGTLEQQLNDRRVSEPRQPWLRAIRKGPAEAAGNGLEASAALAAAARADLVLDNGSGGFAKDGSEYVIVLANGEATPAPWVNVLANANFGSVVSESGMAYSWCENAHEFRLTPWHNDPISDAGGEALYLRDEESGSFWSPTPLPARASGHYVVRHGFGYSVYCTSANGIYSELWVYVALDAPIKFSLLKLRNESGRPRKLSATAYVEWVLGDLAAKTAMHVATEIDVRNGALYARNAYNTEFPERVGFLDVDDRTRSFSGDRSEFIGRNGSLKNPAAMRRSRLSGRVGAALDPCGAMQVLIDLADGEERELVFRLGGAPNAETAGQVVQRFRGLFIARATLQSVRQFWQRTLGAVQVATPEPAADLLANGWLVYQVLACRFWARSGYYQSGGAFGFRDQLQDAMALVHATPWLLRDQLLLCASRQFVEGDVQHWWHPPAGRGVRTHCSDDYLWLPLAIARYVLATSDTGVLDAAAPFLEGRPVPAGEESYYDLPGLSPERASLYEHGVRAIRHGLRYGERGLPLIGSGDWNDGMNRVGIEGRGESVWLAFFLCQVLREYAELARRYGDLPFADFCLGEEARLRENIEQHAWDGAWYRRAWFDDGTPLGAHDNLECRIDSIAQSWSVLSAVGRGAPGGDPTLGPGARARVAMASLNANLVRRDARLVQLLDPPFDKTPLDPGYIRGYLPGVRENGGQYTHAAVWAAMAFAALGENDLAWELLGLINPLRHAQTPSDVEVYKVEPYVIAADVYAAAPHTGRGGWSWYTGSAGWAYRLIVEALLGLRLAGTSLHLDPRVPRHWPGYTISYRYRETVYRISVTQASGTEPTAVRSVQVDDVAQAEMTIPLVDDRREHEVKVELG